jgi:hypothetical protein
VAGIAMCGNRDVEEWVPNSISTSVLKAPLNGTSWRADAGVGARTNTAVKQARSNGVAKRRCDRKRFRVNQ